MPSIVSARLFETVELQVDGHRIDVGGPRQQAVIAILLLVRGRPLSIDALAETVWDGAPPPSAIATLRVYLARIRKALDSAGSRLVRDSGGYRFDIEPTEVDLYRFEDAVDYAMSLHLPEDAAQIATALGPAIDCPAFLAPDTLRDQGWMGPFQGRLTARRADAVELLAAAELHLGETQKALSLLEDAVSQHPMREGLVQSLMVALYRAGRQTEALDAYRDCRALLREELGAAPCKALQETQQTVLRHDPALDWVPTSLTSTHSSLPARDPRFHARQTELAFIADALRRRETVVCTGLGGAGKTAIAVEVAHQHDGPVIWVPGETEAAMATRLQNLARQTGIHATGQEDWLRRLWDVAAAVPDLLVVFDNVDNPALLRHYRPTNPHMLTVVTSRHAAWNDIAVTIEVEPFPPADARTFVTERTRYSDDDAGRLATELGQLPLALVQATAFIDQADITCGEYLRLYRDRREEMIARGQPPDYPQTIATTWTLALEGVTAESPSAAQILNAVAFLDPDSIPTSLLSGLFDLPDPSLEIAEAIGDLRRFSLVKRNGAALGIHRLVQNTIRDGLNPQQRHHALTTASHLVALASAQASHQEGRERSATLRMLTPHVLAVGQHANADNLPSGELLQAMRDCATEMSEQGTPRAARSLMAEAVQMAESMELDPITRGTIHSELGSVLDAAGDLDDALAQAKAAVTILERHLIASDRRLLRARTRLAHVLNCAGEHEASATLHRQALTALTPREVDDPMVVDVLIDLGYAEWAAHHLPQAKDAFETARRNQLPEPTHTDQGQRHAHATAGLGLVYQDYGDLDTAAAFQRQAVAEFRTIHGDRDHPDIGQALDKLGYVLRLLGDLSSAADAHDEAVAMLSRCYGEADPRLAMALTNRGLTRSASADDRGAESDHQRAYLLFAEAYGPQHPHTVLASTRLADATSSPTRPTPLRAMESTEKPRRNRESRLVVTPDLA